MKDKEGRTYPARVYYNEASATLAPLLAEQATVLTERGADEARLEPGDIDLDEVVIADGPFFHVEVDPADDGTVPVGWTASYTALGSTISIQPNIDQPGGQDGDDAAQYSAQHLYSGWNLLSSNSPLFHTFLTCSDGAKAVQRSCQWWQNGDGFVGFRRDNSDPNGLQEKNFNPPGNCVKSVERGGNGLFRVRNRIGNTGTSTGLGGNGDAHCFFAP